MGESGSQTGRGGVAERGGACPGCDLKEEILIAICAGVVGGLEGVCLRRRCRAGRNRCGVSGLWDGDAVGAGEAAGRSRHVPGDASATRQRASVGGGCAGGGLVLDGGRRRSASESSFGGRGQSTATAAPTLCSPAQAHLSLGQRTACVPCAARKRRVCRPQLHLHGESRGREESKRSASVLPPVLQDKVPGPETHRTRRLVQAAATHVPRPPDVLPGAPCRCTVVAPA